MTQDIIKRTGFTFLTHSTRSIITLASGLILARMMGPDMFGKMSFLVAIFVSFKALFDFGSGSAFYTFICQSKLNKKV